jgi:hypothetical protein
VESAVSPPAVLADKARELYGARNEEFIESIKAFAYYPIAVYKGLDNFENGEISVRFQMIGGTLDRRAGILFDVKPNGDYLTVRYNGTEDNVVLWTFNNGGAEVREPRADARAARARHLAHAESPASTARR